MCRVIDLNVGGTRQARKKVAYTRTYRVVSLAGKVDGRKEAWRVLDDASWKLQKTRQLGLLEGARLEGGNVLVTWMAVNLKQAYLGMRGRWGRAGCDRRVW
jgi:hypothetical protein